MVIIKLTGGLGNQLFQYAYGRALSLERNESFFLDTSWYRGRKDRAYLLNNFSIHTRLTNIFHRIFCKKSYLQDTRGEWHSEKYFIKYADIIRKDLELKILPEQQFEMNSVSIHLRGGDYVRGNKSNFHGTCSPEYYAEAIKSIRERIQNPHFYIFTDDIEWARNHIQFPEPYTLVSNGSIPPYKELILMSNCKHNIIANSTFSWWGAWLNKNPDKIVIAPKKWFVDEKIDVSGILPSSWIQL